MQQYLKCTIFESGDCDKQIISVITHRQTKITELVMMLSSITLDAET